MSKSEYLSALSKALAGLPPETVAKTLAYYEQRFIDGLALGRSEADIAQELDEPRKIAMTLRANAHLHAFEEKRNPANLARMAMSFLGLAVFNLFMVVPAVVYASLLMALYACAFSFYVSGIAITASGLAGANELVLNGPLRHLVIFDDDQAEDRSMQTRVSIGADGLQVQQEPSAALQAALDNETSRSGRLMEKAEAVAESGVRISTDMDTDSRTAQTAIGIGLILGGILLCLLSIVVTRFTAIGIRRYIEMNFSLLRGR